MFCGRVLGVAVFQIALVLTLASGYYPAQAQWREVKVRHQRDGKEPTTRNQKRERDVERFRVKQSAPDCPRDCNLVIQNQNYIRDTFQDWFEESDTTLVHFKVHFKDQNASLLETFPYMGRNFRASEWVWASGNTGRRLLGLPLDADVLSLYIFPNNRRYLDVQMTSYPPRCFIMLSPECRLYVTRRELIYNVTHAERHRHHRDFFCHKVVNNSETLKYSYLGYRCCDISEFVDGDHLCQVHINNTKELTSVVTIVNIIALIFTLFSPVFIMRIKLALKFDAVTKFFRASLKHGITGQRNYVIRISSRQLINLSDPKPFSIPRFMFRMIFHCYGEGRCCIHWWGEWHHQPGICKRDGSCRKCWVFFWRIFAVAIVYPTILYIALALYAPKLGFYTSLIDFVHELEDVYPIQLNINPFASSLLPGYATGMAIWTLFSFVAFVYTVLLLSWPNNPLERCLLRVNARKPHEHPYKLYDRMTRGYKRILTKLAYGDFNTKTHFFRIRWLPWGVRRVFHFIRRVLLQVPVINICFSLTMFDTKLFHLRDEEKSDHDETKSAMEFSFPSVRSCCKAFMSIFLWLGFVAVLCGYSTAVFYMVEFVLNVIFFTFLGSTLHASTVLPWIGLAVVIAFYVNDTLTMINDEHKEILRLIDENSPRISAVEDSEDVFRDPGTVQILRTHNLGAVKFIDGDNTEYVSKELYYNVCADLKCGWSRSIRRIFVRLTVIFLFVIFIFISLSALGAFTGSGILVTIAAMVGSLIPKAIEVYQTAAPSKKDPKAMWAKIMPDILDRHIRVDRTLCVDDFEEELTTYDVRPVGLLEMDIPKVVKWRSLNLWKFPWIVSADQQTQSPEAFVLALANKLAAASFLSKVVTRAYSPALDEENCLRQWCLLVENCILEGSATASSINGVPVESIRLFPRDVQPLVSPFNPGNTIDNAVDNINRELYGPFTKGVLVTISNTTFAICKLNSKIFAFNSSCHGDQVTDLFGAVLIATDFNTQNLQTTLKFIVDPYSPDAVPVYSMVPTEGFIFRSPEVMEVESPVESI